MFLNNLKTTFLRKALCHSIVFFLFLQLSSVTSYAQYTELLDFGSSSNGTHPYSSLISDGAYFYGTTFDGGLNGVGTIYKIKPDGTGFTKLLDFDGDNGSNPIGSLFFDGTFLYGTASQGGTDGHGTLFKVMPDGTNFSKLLDFIYTTSGAFPYGSLISDGAFLYGTTTQGGANGEGTVFKVLKDGSGFVNLFQFDGPINGGQPYGSLYFDGTFLYGTTSGGFSFLGTVFKIKADGTGGFATLHQFSSGGNGVHPYGSLISDGTFLYGMTTSIGDFSHYGTLFKIMPNGTGFATVLNFNNSNPGANPKGSLTYDGTFLYGTTTDYGAESRGTIFKIKPDGSSYTSLLNNDVGTNNSPPEGTMLLIGSTLYGAKSGDGAGTAPFLPGTLFKINTDGTAYTKFFYFETEGNAPNGSLFSDGTFQYGVTSAGGLYNEGIIYKVKLDGTGFTSLFDFENTTTGNSPSGALISDGTFLYGATQNGSTGTGGTLYKIKPDGSGYVQFLNFDYTTNGGEPNALIYDGTFLYGTTSHGGSASYGTIFKIKPDGTGYVKLLDFDYNNNGAYPNGALYSDGTFLYGATNQGGTNGGWGTLFKIKTDGSGFAKLIDFDYMTTGSNPTGSLISDGTFLYGMANSGGATNQGVVFKIKTDGTNYTKLLDFDGDNTGSYPYGSFFSDGTFLYGSTSQGGVLGSGIIFKMKYDGTSFIKLIDLSNGGTTNQNSFISDGTFLYGTTSNGGNYSLGTYFKSTLTPFVSISNITPANGIIGTQLTIQGTDFDPTPANNIVKFNGTLAPVISSTANTLTVFVPVGATTGPISVTANGMTGTSSDFTVTAQAEMTNATIQSCNAQLIPPTYQYIQSNNYDNIVETFLPVNPSDKIKVSFSSFDGGDDVLNIYDGPSTSSPLIISLNIDSAPTTDIIATGPGGELTFEFSWSDSQSTIWQATISCQSTSSANITISTQPSNFTACADDIATFSTAASGTTNITYQWQFSVDAIAPFVDIANGSGYSNVTTSTLSVNTSGSFGAGRYRCKIDGDLATTVFTNDEGLFVNALPTAPTVQGASACPSSSLILSASGGTNGNYLWYTVKSGGTAISGEVNSSYTSPLLSVTTTYYVSITNGTCESPRSAVVATINVCNPPTIATQPLATQIGGIITIDLKPLITTANLDLSSLQIITLPANAASASIDANGILTINYVGKSFAGTDKITIKACDVNGQCSTQDFSIDVTGDIIVFNAVSPNGANPTFFIQYIDVLPDTKNNSVYIFDRWENQVWHGSNYNNSTVVFSGISDGGSDLPPGVYFYKIDFASGKKTRTGFISLRR